MISKRRSSRITLILVCSAGIKRLVPVHDYEEDIDDNESQDQGREPENELEQGKRFSSNVQGDALLKLEEQLFVDIEKTFAGIAGDSIIGQLAFSEV